MTVPQPHNLTMMGNSSGMGTLWTTVDANLMYGYLGTLILVTIFIMSFISFMFYTKSAGKSFIGSSFICFLLSFLLLVFEIIPDLVMFGSLALLGLSVAFVKKLD